MKKHLVFLDIDGTLIDSNYQPNDNSLPKLIELIESRGDVVFALNSNRSLEDILPIANKFSIKGAVVCENGLFVYFPETKQSLHLADSEHLKRLATLREDVFSWARESADIFKTEIKWTTAEFDTATNSKEDDLVIIKPVTTRKYTVSLHLRKLVNGEVIPFKEGAFLLAKHLQEKIDLIGLKNDVLVRVSDSHPSILIYSKKYTKHDGALHLRNNVYPNSSVIAIGNDPDDFEMVKDTGEFWSVKNGKPAALALASKVASTEYTKGVIELLQNYFING